jgi:hypothetical protein
MLTSGLVSSWRDRVVAGVVVALFLVPAVILLAGPKPSRFGFQMYSGYGVVSAIWEDRSGARHEVELTEHVANDRAEVDWTATLPEQLCPRFPDAVEVQVRRTQPGTDQVRTVSC